MINRNYATVKPACLFQKERGFQRNMKCFSHVIASAGSFATLFGMSWRHDSISADPMNEAISDEMLIGRMESKKLLKPVIASNRNSFSEDSLTSAASNNSALAAKPAGAKVSNSGSEMPPMRLQPQQNAPFTEDQVRQFLNSKNRQFSDLIILYRNITTCENSDMRRPSMQKCRIQ